VALVFVFVLVSSSHDRRRRQTRRRRRRWWWWWWWWWSSRGVLCVSSSVFSVEAVPVIVGCMCTPTPPFGRDGCIFDQTTKAKNNNAEKMPSFFFVFLKIFFGFFFPLFGLQKQEQ